MLYKRHRIGNQERGLLALIDDLPVGIVMAEIGVYAGEGTELFIRSGKVKKIYCIDPWIRYHISEKYDNSHICAAEARFDGLENTEIVKLKGKIDDFIDDLPMLDFVYIDGLHTYEAVQNDIIKAKKKMKPGSIIGGHDYRELYKDRVVKAVDETIGKPDKVYEDGSWIRMLI